MLKTFFTTNEAESPVNSAPAMAVSFDQASLIGAAMFELGGEKFYAGIKKLP